MPNQNRGGGKTAATGNRMHARRHGRMLLARRQQRQARNRLLPRVGAPVLVVIVVIATLVIVKLAQRSPAASAAAPSHPAADTVTRLLSTVPSATFDSVGAGTMKAAPAAISGPGLTANGKPRVLYIGAEYCPYCAAERWSVVVALSRFGSFSGLGQTTSASADVYPRTAAVSFHGAHYASTVLSFTGVETTTNIRSGNGYAPLDTPTAADQALLTRYNSSGSIPFVDIGNRFIISGASFDPGTLQGLTHRQIASQISDPTTPVAQAIDGTANMITAALCTLTNNTPAGVCSSAGVKAGASTLPTRSGQR